MYTKDKAGIYKIRNLKNNKMYVGSTIGLLNRKHQHFEDLKNNRHHNKHLQSSYNKYGHDNFVFEVIEYIDNTENLNDLKCKLLEKEQNYIDILRVTDRKFGYNKRIKAESNLGRKFSKEHCIRISESKKGKPRSKDAVEKTANKLKGRKMPESVKEAIAKYNINKKLTEEHKNKISNARKGLKHSEDTKNKMSIKRRKRTLNITTGEIFNSVKEAATKYGVRDCTISLACRTGNKTKDGSYWKYI